MSQDVQTSTFLHPGWASIGHDSVFLGKGIVCLVSGSVCWLLLPTTVSTPVLPLFVACIAGYAVAHAFLTMYEVLLKTVLISFVVDESFHGKGNSFYAPDALKTLVNTKLRPS